MDRQKYTGEAILLVGLTELDRDKVTQDQIYALQLILWAETVS